MTYHRPKPMARAAACAVLVLAIAALTLATAHAAMIPQSLDDLVANSTHIVRGEVLSTQARWDPTHSYIYTTVTLNVTQWHMGTPRQSETITLFVPGGEVGTKGLRVEHAPHFASGEDVIVFLEDIGTDGMFSVTSWEQGKYTVVNGNVREKKLPVAQFTRDIEQAVQR